MYFIFQIEFVCLNLPWPVIVPVYVLNNFQLHHRLPNCPEQSIAFEEDSLT